MDDSQADIFVVRLDGKGHVVWSGRGTSDVFVAWLDGAGKHVASARFGDGADDACVDIGLDGNGNVLLARR